MSSEHFEKAKVHLDREQWPEAVACLTKHLNGHFFDPLAAMMLGYCHIMMGNPGLAAMLCRQAVHTKPKFPEGWRNLGGAFKSAHMNEDAERAFLRALEQEDEPIHKARTYANLGTLHINEGSPEKALAYLDKSLELEPDGEASYHTKWNRALALLELGRWQEGFQGYEYRFPTGAMRSRTYGNLKAWDGTPGKKVIVWGEQGVGDEIMFGTVLPDAIKNCEAVIFDCHPRLTKLFARSFPGVAIHGTRKLQTTIDWFKPGMADCHVSLSSLPVLYRRTAEEFPGTPYLKADEAEAAKLKAQGNGKLRVGISWAGGAHKTRADLRTVQLKNWLPILKAIDADFYSLQYTDKAAREVCEIEEEHGIRIKHFPGWVECKDYDKTASFVKSMDLVITVCTSVLHLAGALGVPTWCLVPSKPAWRYGLTGEKSIWYNSVKLVRQGKDETWEPVIERVASDLRGWMKAAA